jgi:hypothetical protein
MAAEQKPDFSGEYVLDLQASALTGGAAAVRSAVLRFEHREPKVRCRGAFTFDDTSFNYTVELVSDGREVVDGQEPPTTSSLCWDSDALVFVHRTDAADAPVTMSWHYELDDSGRRLTATERIRGGGRDQDNVWVFERRDGAVLAGDELLFSYGTLRLEAVQMEVFGRQLSGTPDALPEFETGALKIDDEAVVAISGQTHHPMATFTGRPSDVIAGTVFTLTPDEIQNADKYEVAAVKRVSVVLQSGIRAWAYVDARYAPPTS